MAWEYRADVLQKYGIIETKEFTNKKDAIAWARLKVYESRNGAYILRREKGDGKWELLRRVDYDTYSLKAKYREIDRMVFGGKDVIR